MFPEKGIKTWFRDLGLALLTLLLLQIYTCKLSSQALGPLGQTTCDSLGHPQILIRQDIMGTPKGAQVLAHEMVHVRQMLKHPGRCRGAVEQYKTDPDFRFSQELEAYCYDIVHDTSIQYQLSVDILAINIYNRYGQHMPYDIAKKKVNEECIRQLLIRAS